MRGRYVFLSDFHPYDRSAFITGSHLQVYNIAKATLRKAETHLLVSTNDKEKVWKVVDEDGLTVHYLPNPRFEIQKIPIFLKRVLELKPTCVFQRGRSSLTFVGFLSKVLISSKFVWSSNAVEGVDFLKFSRFLYNRKKYLFPFGLLLDVIINIGLEGCDVVVAQNEEQRAKAERRFWWKDVRMCKNIQELPEDIPAKSEKPKVIWVGRLDENKNPGIFLRLAEIFPEYEFLMVGYGNERLIRDKPDNLKFLGKLERGEVLKLLGESWVLVHTGNYESEGIPNVIIEAMLCETPVLTLYVNMGVLERFNLYCGSFENLIQRLRDLLSSRERVVETGKVLKDWAVKTFVEESVKCWENVLGL